MRGKTVVYFFFQAFWIFAWKMTQTILQLLHWLAINFQQIKQSINRAPVHLLAGNIIFLSGCQRQILPAWEQFIWGIFTGITFWVRYFLFDNKQVLKKKDFEGVKVRPCCSRAGNCSFFITVTALNSSTSPDIKLWKSARGFKTHLRLREILQDLFMSDWNRCPLKPLVQALTAHHIILYVAGWLQFMKRPDVGVTSYFCWGPPLPSYDQCVSDFALWCLHSSLWDNFLLISGPNASLWWKAWAGHLDRTELDNRACFFFFPLIHLSG